jgi:hypothetical protein
MKETSAYKAAITNLIISHTKLQLDESQPQVLCCLRFVGRYGTCVLLQMTEFTVPSPFKATT